MDQRARRRENQQLYREELDNLKHVKQRQLSEREQVERAANERLRQLNAEASDQARQHAASRRQAYQQLMKDNEMMKDVDYKERLIREHQKRLSESVDQS